MGRAPSGALPSCVMRRIDMTRYWITEGAMPMEDSFFSDFIGTGSGRKFPPVDAYETAEGYTIEMDVPGYGEGDISVNLKDSILTIASQGGAKRAFSRSFRLPKDADAARIEAGSSNGVLTITIPHRAAQPESGRIEVRIGR